MWANRNQSRVRNTNDKCSQVSGSSNRFLHVPSLLLEVCFAAVDAHRSSLAAFAAPAIPTAGQLNVSHHPKKQYLFDPFITLYISYPCVGWYTEELWVSDFEWSCTVSGPTNNRQHYAPCSSQTMVMECQVCPTSSDFERRTFMKACANFISLLISPLPQLLLLQAAPSITMYS